MSLIVAARFDAFADAESAARRLFALGFPEEDVSIFFVNPGGQHGRYPLGGDEASDPSARSALRGAIGGAALLGTVGALIGLLISLAADGSIWTLLPAVGVGAYIGSLAGALLATRATARAEQAGQSTGAVRRAGVLIAVHVTVESEARVAETLRDAGGKDVEKAAGNWLAGNWVDFDPVAAPILSDKVRSVPG